MLSTGHLSLTMIDLAEKESEWKLTIDLEEGLRRTIEYFRIQLGIH